MPTFLDIGESFATRQLLEDNLLSQLLAQGKRLAAFGDDTWQGLFPDSVWSHSQFFPSLVVHDLDTVDDGVWKVRTMPLAKTKNSQSIVQ